jgi:hypothetical protein
MAELQEDHSYATPEELAFLKVQTGIQDEDELKAHVLAVQKKAREVCLNAVSPLATTAPAPGVRLPVHSPLRIHQVKDIIIPTMNVLSACSQNQDKQI